MRGRTLQIILIAVSLMGTGASGFFMWQSASALSQLPQSPLTTATASEHGEGAGKSEAAGHGAAPAQGGHGEKPAEGHGEAAAASGHGEAPAGGHGETAAADAHGAARGPASRKDITPLVSLDEIFANVTDERDNHTLAVKLELELFQEGDRNTIDQLQSGIKDTIIQASREQLYDRLNTQSGKLYYKEFLVSKLNEYFQKPLIRDVHFASFFLQ